MTNSITYEVTDVLRIRHDHEDGVWQRHRLVALLGSDPEQPMSENVGEWAAYRAVASVRDQFGCEYEGTTDFVGEAVSVVHRLQVYSPVGQGARS